MAAKLCNVCNIRRPKTGSKGTEVSSYPDMCNYCHEEGGWENTHSDYGHDHIAKQIEAGNGADLSKSEQEEAVTMAHCWICHPERNLAKKPAKAGSGPKTQGARRPQLNHKGHHHPQTPAARRACKAAFWAEMAKSGITVANVTESAFAGWDYQCDGHGKPMPTPAPAKLTVVPRGPKGGVLNQIKAAKPN
jgi:hypothetical protein